MYKADINGWTPLHASARYNRLEFVKWLVTKRGVDVNQLDNYGRTPLSLAIDFGPTAIVSFLQHWTLSVLPRRAVLASVILARRQPSLPPAFVPELLRRLAAAPDDIVRAILEFV